LNAYRLARSLMLQNFHISMFNPVMSFVVQEWDPPTTTVHIQTPNLESSSVPRCTGADKGRAVFSQLEIGDQIWIQCRQYRQSTSKSIVELKYVWFLSFRAVPKTAPKPPNSSASVLKTSSHERRRCKTAKHWFCWIPRKRWAKMVSEVPKMMVLWNFRN